eukprot:4394371-Pleurochrysis_carterae.AAC.3
MPIGHGGSWPNLLKFPTYLPCNFVLVYRRREGVHGHPQTAVVTISLPSLPPASTPATHLEPGTVAAPFVFIQGEELSPMEIVPRFLPTVLGILWFARTADIVLFFDWLFRTGPVSSVDFLMIALTLLAPLLTMHCQAALMNGRNLLVEGAAMPLAGLVPFGAVPAWVKLELAPGGSSQISELGWKKTLRSVLSLSYFHHAPNLVWFVVALALHVGAPYDISGNPPPPRLQYLICLPVFQAL